MCATKTINMECVQKQWEVGWKGGIGVRTGDKKSGKALFRTEDEKVTDTTNHFAGIV